MSMSTKLQNFWSSVSDPRYNATTAGVLYPGQSKAPNSKTYSSSSPNDISRFDRSSRRCQSSLNIQHSHGYPTSAAEPRRIQIPRKLSTPHQHGNIHVPCKVCQENSNVNKKHQQHPQQRHPPVERSASSAHEFLASPSSAHNNNNDVRYSMTRRNSTSSTFASATPGSRSALVPAMNYANQMQHHHHPVSAMVYVEANGGGGSSPNGTVSKFIVPHQGSDAKSLDRNHRLPIESLLEERQSTCPNPDVTPPSPYESVKRNDSDILADLEQQVETAEDLAIMAISKKPQTPDFNAGDITWVLASTFLVFLMTPGLGFFYSGMAKSKSALHILMLCFVSMVIVSIQWFCFGYSLTFSNTSSGSHLSSIIGNFDNAFMMNMANEPSILNDKIPALVFYLFQNMFAAITPALAIGAAAERGRFLPCIVFMLFWTTFVYDVLAYWSWNPNGWVAKMGALDFAGGTPIHIASGAAALAYAVVLGPRKEPQRESAPHNMANVVLGTALIWFGWFGFNGGSALAANSRAIMACIVTNLAACVGGVTWITIDYFFEDRKYSPMGFCAGVIAGLVSVTPASGFISPASSLAFGFFGAICCRLALYSKRYWKLDDALDVFAVHGVGGIVGNLLTGIFAQKWVAALDGAEIDGGWLDGNWVQIVWQTADTVAGLAWSFAVTWILLYVMNKIPGLSLRVKAEKETAGLDSAELGITAYEHIIDAIKQGIQLTRSARKISNPGSPVNEINGNNVVVAMPMNGM